MSWPQIYADYAKAFYVGRTHEKSQRGLESQLLILKL